MSGRHVHASLLAWVAEGWTANLNGVFAPFLSPPLINFSSHRFPLNLVFTLSSRCFVLSLCRRSRSHERSDRCPRDGPTRTTISPIMSGTSSRSATERSALHAVSHFLYFTHLKHTWFDRPNDSIAAMVLYLHQSGPSVRDFHLRRDAPSMPAVSVYHRPPLHQTGRQHRRVPSAMLPRNSPSVGHGSQSGDTKAVVATAQAVTDRQDSIGCCLAPSSDFGMCHWASDCGGRSLADSHV